MAGGPFENTPTAQTGGGPVRFIDHSQIYKKQIPEANQKWFQNQMDRNMNGSKQRSRRRILKEIIAQDGTHQMVVFNEEEEESKSRYDGDYSQPVTTAAYSGVQITDQSLGSYVKQYGATTKVISHSPGLGGGLLGAGPHAALIGTENTEDGAILNLDGHDAEEAAGLDDEDDFFN